ncbi:uncharacterized protein EV422DRAFT_119321 [Fimicolochytrium jonesii]|uniref:uncharacterized protein n=1 Tax=Fimicolochytrium jonesii TaxID=1396493 RepID=UPI0022FE2E42|nr:uncharacterized protein EV422DRAFT_119321 [Fimicolochytrium jonesii]KAI8819145.1 hypothetical protein EV422DRAFT_119321 [Fimicolochytrium jonesii]
MDPEEAAPLDHPVETTSQQADWQFTARHRLDAFLARCRSRPESVRGVRSITLRERNGNTGVMLGWFNDEEDDLLITPEDVEVFAGACSNLDRLQLDWDNFDFASENFTVPALIPLASRLGSLSLGDYSPGRDAQVAFMQEYLPAAANTLQTLSLRRSLFLTEPMWQSMTHHLQALVKLSIAFPEDLASWQSEERDFGAPVTISASAWLASDLHKLSSLRHLRLKYSGEWTPPDLQQVEVRHPAVTTLDVSPILMLSPRSLQERCLPQLKELFLTARSTEIDFWEQHRVPHRSLVVRQHRLLKALMDTPGFGRLSRLSLRNRSVASVIDAGIVDGIFRAGTSLQELVLPGTTTLSTSSSGLQVETNSDGVSVRRSFMIR